MQLFVPPDSKGRNVKCIVKIKLPTSVGDVLPARTKTCGALFKHTKGDRVAGVSGSGTSGLKHHLQKHTGLGTCHEQGGEDLLGA